VLSQVISRNSNYNLFPAPSPRYGLPFHDPVHAFYTVWDIHTDSSAVIGIQWTELPEAVICLLSQHRSGAAQLERAATGRMEMDNASLRVEPRFSASSWESKHCHISPT